jgi:Domain of unknown function (DUF3387)
MILGVLTSDLRRPKPHFIVLLVKPELISIWTKMRGGSARAKMRVLVKHILKKYGYPPDLAVDAVKLVLEQAETLLAQF